MVNRVTVYRGAALATLARFADDTYDLAYIDADKPGYPAYLRECMRLVRPGGVIVADNLFLAGRTVDKATTDEGATAMRATAEHAASDPRLTTVALAIGDGVLLAVVGE